VLVLGCTESLLTSLHTATGTHQQAARSSSKPRPWARNHSSSICRNTHWPQEHSNSFHPTSSLAIPRLFALMNNLVRFADTATVSNPTLDDSAPLLHNQQISHDLDPKYPATSFIAPVRSTTHKQPPSGVLSRALLSPVC
jgi:hypothetical protein